MKAKKPTISYGLVHNPKDAHGYKNVRWVENASKGLRLVGFADEIAQSEGRWRMIGHTGWFTDEFQDDKYRGVVYQIPSRNGACYVYGYSDPISTDSVLLCFDLESDKMEAALAADRFAEIFAEEAREYNRAFQAGRKFEELAEEVKDHRKETLALCAEMRQLRKQGVNAPASCAALRGRIYDLLRLIRNARKERKGLLADFGRQPGFVE